jgi:hypothetical protein
MPGRRVARFCALLCGLSASAALAQGIESAIMPGQVIQGHAKLEAECKNCHVRFNRAAQAGQCLDCHKVIARDRSQHKGYHGRMQETDCRTCHTEHKGRNANIAPLSARTFEHQKTDFELKGAHAKVECASCHVPPKKHREAPSACYGCHKKDDHHKGKLGTACANCHGETSWKQTRFDHSKTRFALKNSHANVPCETCHAGKKFKGTPLACVACHQQDDQKKGHQGKFGKQCETCHTDKAWKATKFNHEREASWPLRGRHQAVRCQSCHTGVLHQQKLPTSCVACHRKDDAKSHQGRLGTKCESCHSETGWTSTKFDHGKTAHFPLRGKHAQVKCQSCHTGASYQEKLASTCVSCHRKDDAHKGQLGVQCESCHTEAAWRQARIDHGLTRFPLHGKHAGVKCQACHTTARFKDAETGCHSCHVKDDKHKQRLGTLCEQCHNPRSWKQWDFDHDKRTAFVLEGKHRGLECLACHRYPLQGKASLGRACASCHESVDPHNGGFGRMCERCHVTSTFKTIRPGSTGRLMQ